MDGIFSQFRTACNVRAPLLEDRCRTGQDPQLDAGLVQHRDRLWHTLLQLVLQGRRAEDDEIVLDELACTLNLFFAVDDGSASLVVDL